MHYGALSLFKLRNAKWRCDRW